VIRLIRLQRARYQRAFTLIEVLIALAILAIALAAVTRAARIATDTAQETKLRTLATWVAQNRLAEITAASATQFPGVSETAGSTTMANVEFAWRQKISATPNRAFRKVEVAVLRPNTPDVLANMNTFIVNAAGDAQ
jgi:general secretion pathway protein I